LWLSTDDPFREIGHVGSTCPDAAHRFNGSGKKEVMSPGNMQGFSMMVAKNQREFTQPQVL